MKDFNDNNKPNCIDLYLVNDGVVDCLMPNGTKEEKFTDVEEISYTKTKSISFDQKQLANSLFLKIRRNAVVKEKHKEIYYHVSLIRNTQNLKHGNLEIKSKQSTGEVIIKMKIPKLIDCGIYSVLIHDSISPSPTFRNFYFVAKGNFQIPRKGLLEFDSIFLSNPSLKYILEVNSQNYNYLNLDLTPDTTISFTMFQSGYKLVDSTYSAGDEIPFWITNEDYKTSKFCPDNYGRISIRYSIPNNIITYNINENINFIKEEKIHVECDYEIFKIKTTYNVYSKEVTPVLTTQSSSKSTSTTQSSSKSTSTLSPIIDVIDGLECTYDSNNNLLILPSILKDNKDEIKFCQKCSKIYAPSLNNCIDPAYDINLDESKMPYDLLNVNYTIIYVSYSTIIFRKQSNNVYRLVGHFDQNKRTVKGIAELLIDESMYALKFSDEFLNSLSITNFEYFLKTFNTNNQLVSSIKLRKYRYTTPTN